MKARTIPQEIALLYHLGKGTPRGRRVQEVLDELGIPCRELGPEDLCQSIGWCAGLAGYRPAQPPAQPPAPVREEALLLGGLTKDRLDHLLAQLKESELSIELKAVITPYNREWTLAKLFSELQEEHRFFQRVQRLTQLTERAEAQAGGDGELDAAAREGRRILEADKAPEPLTLQNAIEGLEAALSKL
ncbi:DUF3783 domain-containing protein [Bittarella massiliensis (ex Durand et al. 2017)]|uniref:DUF3783 domain-containing protein n=1 Tax=Bittarella massiliensis (ex Durand et al. 2017) TaxID=1720313 RepID=UPI001AA15E93|nr:DUF3783 domain-containing protein [Bittarella massiliensis (ex Durand et al. 2017)]MBO1680152.1 DUF3783 domain-containing protein [Bittarella massiliensis (ex Durand et al. 2017)]